MRLPLFWEPQIRSTLWLTLSAESPDEAGVADQESEDDLSASRTSLERQAPHRGNTMVHVCWHRNTSVSMVDFSVAVEVSGGVAMHGAGPHPQVTAEA